MPVHIWRHSPLTAPIIHSPKSPKQPLLCRARVCVSSGMPMPMPLAVNCDLQRNPIFRLVPWPNRGADCR